LDRETVGLDRSGRGDRPDFIITGEGVFPTLGELLDELVRDFVGLKVRKLGGLADMFSHSLIGDK